MKYMLALAMALMLNATANLLLKFGVKRFGTAGLTLENGMVPAAVAFVNNSLLMLGLACFATNVLFYMYSLSGIKISVAYPVMFGGGFTIIALVAWRFLGETLSPGQWAGIGLIAMGIVLVTREMKAVPGG